jgi:hypothetical protein
MPSNNSIFRELPKAIKQIALHYGFTMAMQRITLFKLSAIGLAIGSCLSLAASLMLVFEIAISYIIPHSIGSYDIGVQHVDATFYVMILVSIFGFLASALGLTSTIKAPNGSKTASVGAIFLLFAGVLLFSNYLPSAFGGWWSILNWNFGLPIVILASFYLVALARKKEEINLDKKSTLFLNSGSIMVFCALETGFFLFLFPTKLYFLILSICAVAFALTAGILMFYKKFQVATALTALTFLFGMSLSVIFLTMFSQVPEASWIVGLLYESPTIVLSAVALVLAFLGQRNVTEQQSNR